MKDITTHGVLPPDVQLGHCVRVKVGEDETVLTGKVVAIPPHWRFGVIQFEVQALTQWGTRTVHTYQECWPIAPSAWRY